MRLLPLPGLELVAESTAADGVPIGTRLGDLLLGGNFKKFRALPSDVGDLVSAKLGEQVAFTLL